MRTANANGTPPRRLRALPRREVLGAQYPVATSRRARLLGLAFVDREQAGPGLFIPDCRSVHTFGMRFRLDLYFLGLYGEMLAVRRQVPPLRLVYHREASAILELPSWGTPTVPGSPGEGP